MAQPNVYSPCTAFAEGAERSDNFVSVEQLIEDFIAAVDAARSTP
jgi:hypothetical protein